MQESEMLISRQKKSTLPVPSLNGITMAKSHECMNEAQGERREHWGRRIIIWAAAPLFLVLLVLSIITYITLVLYRHPIQIYIY